MTLRTSSASTATFRRPPRAGNGRAAALEASVRFRRHRLLIFLRHGLDDYAMAMNRSIMALTCSGTSS